MYVLTATQEKAQRSFNYQCRMAKKCRHDTCRISCLSCTNYSQCEIQKAIETAKQKMK